METANNLLSLPVRECGLKFHRFIAQPADKIVTPCAGVWIEIVQSIVYRYCYRSLPVRECGLK